MAPKIWWLLIPAVGILVIGFLVPTVWMLSTTVTDGDGVSANYAELLGSPVYIRILLRTLKAASVVTLISLVVGYPFAYVAATTGPRASTLLMGVIAGSLFISVIVRAYAWLAILDRNGVIDTALVSVGLESFQRPMVHNFTGAVVGLIQYGIPFMVLPIYDSMTRVDQRLSRAAATLGAPPYSSFMRVFFPLTLPGVIVGSLLVFIQTLGYYILPQILGGVSDQMIGQLIADLIGRTVQFGLASALASLLLVVSVTAFVLVSRITRRYQGERFHA